MILLTLLHLFISSIEVPKQQNVAIHIQGNCHDMHTQIPVGVKILAIFEKTQVTLTQGRETDLFSFFVADSVKYLRFENEHYRTSTVPVHVIGSIKGGGNFEIKIPMIEKRWQPFTLQEQKLTEPKTSTGNIKATFEIVDAVNNSPLAARVCLINKITGRKLCQLTRTDSLSWFTLKNKKDEWSLEVSSDGYETYSGNLSTINSPNNTFRYLVRLTRPVSSLSLHPFPSDTLYSNGVVYENKAGKKGSNWPVSTKVLYDITPGTYEFLLQEDIIPVKQNFRVKPGLNFAKVAVRKETHRSSTAYTPKNFISRPSEKTSFEPSIKKHQIKLLTPVTIYFD